MEDNKIKKDDLNAKSPLGVSNLRPAKAGGPKGTGFTNIQSMIKANQGNRLGQTVAGGVQQAGQNVRAGVQQGVQKFGQQVQANRLGAQDQANAEGLVNKASNLQAGQDLSQDELTQAQKYAQGAYQGPQDVENAAQLAGQAAEAEQLGRLGSSSAGRQGLLQRFVGAPQYSFGQQKLDNLLLGSDQGALNQARASTRGVADQAVSSIEAARGQAQEAAVGNRNFAKLFGEKAMGAQGDITSARDAAFEAAKLKEQNAAGAYDQFGKNLAGLYGASNGYRTGQDNAGTMIDSFQGLDPAAKEKLKAVVTQAGELGVDPRAAINGILKQYQGAQGLDDVSAFTNKDQAARINALAKLAGKETQDFSKAGSFKEGSGGIDLEQADKSASSLGNIKQKNQSIQDAGQTHLKAMQNPDSLSDQELRTYLSDVEIKELNESRKKGPGKGAERLLLQRAADKAKQFTQNTQASFDAQKQALIQSFLSRGY
jgi:hypothetical protein